ncbi:MAG: molybdenum cofactor biosynthesis protein B [Pirellulaceae bacterium]|nr:molybdenum cofactor biosynthesis protein MoaB [Planctomycetales bacterium]
MESHLQHKAEAPDGLRCAVITVSDTRTLATDEGGKLVEMYLSDAGHLVTQREIVRDEPDQIRTVIDRLLAFDPPLDAILLTGGTGIARRDRTYETVCGVLDRQLPGYGELFRWLSYQDIGPAAMLSRAVGGAVGATILLTMPGSPKAVRLAMEQLIVPELGHLIREARR